MKLLPKRTKVVSNKNLLLMNFGIKRLRFGHIGENVRICGGSNFFRTENIFIDDNVFISTQNYMEALSQIHIKSGCMIGPRCMFFAGSHNYNSQDLKALPFDDRIVDTPISIEKNVWIGAHVSICPGTHIGEGAVIGMGAVVHGEIAPFSLVVSSSHQIKKLRDIEQYSTLEEKRLIYNEIFAGVPFTMMEKSKL